MCGSSLESNSFIFRHLIQEDLDGWKTYQERENYCFCMCESIGGGGTADHLLYGGRVFSLFLESIG